MELLEKLLRRPLKPDGSRKRQVLEQRDEIERNGDELLILVTESELRQLVEDAHWEERYR